MTRRLGRRRGRTRPGRRLRRPGRHRIPRLLPGLAGGAARRHRRRPGDPGRAGRPAGQRRPPGPGGHRGRGGVHRRRPPPARRRAAPRPHRPGPRRRPGDQRRVLRWAWPLAARAAHDLRDTAAAGELLALLDGYQPGQLAPMLRAERDLARARLAAADGDPDRRPGVRRRDHRPARALHPLPPGPRPARPRRAPDPPGRRRGRRGRDRRSRATSPSGWAASRCWTARRPSSPPGPGPRPRDDGIGPPRPSAAATRPLIRRS